MHRHVLFDLLLRPVAGPVEQVTDGGDPHGLALGVHGQAHQLLRRSVGTCGDALKCLALDLGGRPTMREADVSALDGKALTRVTIGPSS